MNIEYVNGIDIERLHKNYFKLIKNKKFKRKEGKTFTELVIALQNLYYLNEISIVYKNKDLKKFIEDIINLGKKLGFEMNNIQLNKVELIYNLERKTIRLFPSRPYGVDFKTIFKI